ncbi:MAG: helix-turn-helix transcriptional regulator [Henriciella sp.]
MTISRTGSKAHHKSTSENNFGVDPLLTAREGACLLAISEPTFWRHVGNGKLPKPIKLGQLSRWPRSELLEVIEQAKSARNRK